MATILLIHGSWHGAWCWHKVERRLRAQGHTVHTPDLPSHGRDWTPPGEVTLQSCLDRVLPIVDAADEPLLVVAHSRGGLVLSALSEARPERITRAVYLAAILLKDGQTLFDLMPAAEGSLLLPAMVMAEDQTWDMLREEAFNPALYADCDEDDQALCRLLLTPEPLAPSLTPVSLSPERYGRVPRTYIELLQDRAVTPAWQQFMYRAVPCEEVLRLDASHSAYFSQPDALSAMIDALARRP